MSKINTYGGPPSYLENVADRVSVAGPLPHLTGAQEALRAHNELTPQQAVLLWHFLSGAAELQARIDFAVSADAKHFGRLPAHATKEILIAAREMSLVAQDLLKETPALLSRLRAVAEKVIAEGINDAGRE